MCSSRVFVNSVRTVSNQRSSLVTRVRKGNSLARTQFYRTSTAPYVSPHKQTNHGYAISLASYLCIYICSYFTVRTTVTLHKYTIKTCTKARVNSAFTMNNASNNTITIHDTSFTTMSHALSALITFVAVVGIFGNGLLVTATWFTKATTMNGHSLKSKSNHLIAILAASDFLSLIGLLGGGKTVSSESKLPMNDSSWKPARRTNFFPSTGLLQVRVF